MNAFGGLVRTRSSAALTFVRLGLAVVIFPHGAQKVLGVWGGHGFSATMDNFTQQMGIPWILALLAVLAEFLGSIGLFFGFLTRVAAFGIGTVMVVAAVKVHATHGFFMNWHGAKEGEGFEYHVLAAAMALALVIGGAGRASIDRMLAERGRP